MQRSMAVQDVENKKTIKGSALIKRFVPRKVKWHLQKGEQTVCKNQKVLSRPVKCQLLVTTGSQQPCERPWANVSTQGGTRAVSHGKAEAHRALPLTADLWRHNGFREKSRGPSFQCIEPGKHTGLWWRVIPTGSHRQPYLNSMRHKTTVMNMKKIFVRKRRGLQVQEGNERLKGQTKMY